MVHIVFTFCMLAWQAHCQEARPVPEGMSMAACMVQGQQIAQEWLADHPKWMLSRWRCENNIPNQRPI